VRCGRKRLRRGILAVKAKMAGEAPAETEQSGRACAQYAVNYIIAGDIFIGMASCSEARVVSNPEILGGEPVFEGTRIPLSHVVAMVRNGVDATEILEDYRH
jgi:hypothetical protein